MDFPAPVEPVINVCAVNPATFNFTHPIFAVPITAEREEVMTYTPGTIVSGLELPLHLGLPTRSVYGLPVMEHAELDRKSVV